MQPFCLELGGEGAVKLIYTPDFCPLGLSIPAELRHVAERNCLALAKIWRASPFDTLCFS